jgi:chemotaxis protein CheD
MIYTDRRDDVLVTYSLGSCIGLTLYDPSIPVGGLIHCMLPLSRIDPVKAAKSPAMFIDSGVTLLIQNLLNMGASKRALVAKVAGAASLLDENGTFNIGERNYVVLRKILWKNDILISAEETGGSIARTVYFHMDSGRVVIKSQGQERELR